MMTPAITLSRLTEVSLDDIVALLNEPRNARHLPLARGAFTAESAAAWVAAKDAQWGQHGYGPWAVHLDERFAGWGGFQQEEDGADLALVLAPASWGHGAAVVHLMLRVGFEDLGIDAALIALPLSRRDSNRVVARHGFRPAGEITFDGVVFRRYRLEAVDWRSPR